MKEKHISNKHRAQVAEKALYRAIASLNTLEEVQAFFEDLCTPTERQAMADRWEVVRQIMQGIPYRTIQQNTGVSVTTIGRVARCFSLGAGGYKLILERRQKKEDTQDTDTSGAS